MQISSAFEGAFKYGEWLPVWVEVENQGADREIEIRIDVKNDIGTTTYAAQLSLPTSSRKRTPLYVRPNAFSRELPITIIDAANRSSAPLFEEKISVDAVINHTLLVGLFSNERGPLSMIQNIAFSASKGLAELDPNFGEPSDREAKIVDIGAATLPPKGEALRSFDTIIINDIDTSPLTLEQGSALEQWVRAGGDLLIGGGGGAERTVSGLPTTLQPQFIGTPSELEQVDDLIPFASSILAPVEETAEAIRVSGPFVAHLATFTSGSILAGDAESPLVIEKRLGSGTVKYVALSLTESPFDAWAGNTQFLHAALNPTISSTAWLPPDTSLQQMRAGQMSNALNQLPSLNLPSIRWLGILLGIYILLVGPINYLLLRYWRRLHLAWFTIPLLTVAFSAGTFGLGYALRGTDLIVNHIAVIAPQADGSGKVDNYMGLFSPAEQSYDIEIDSDSLIMPMPQSDMFFMGGPPGRAAEAGGDMTIINGSPAQIRDFTVNQWAMQSFQTENRWENFGTISGALTIVDSVLTGEVRNETDQLLEDVVLIIGQQFDRLGDIGAGETMPVEFDIRGLNRNEFGGSIWWNVYSNNQFVEGPSGPTAPENEVKRQIAEAVFQPNYGPPQRLASSNEGVLLIGWIDETPSNVRIADRAPIQQTTALVHIDLPFTWPTTGSLTIPSSFMRVSLLEHPTNGGTCSGANHLHMIGGDAVLQFRLPQGQQFETVETLALQVKKDYYDDDQRKHLVGIEFYNWQEESWSDANEEENDSTESSYEVEQADALISAKGEIRVRITADSANRFDGCRLFDLSVTGKL